MRGAAAARGGARRRLTRAARSYTKPKGAEPDYDEPVILHNKAPSVEEFCNRIHKDIIKHYK